jgi:hypothetical protein
MNIYVGNLSFDATEDEVRELFAAFGQVTSVSLIKDKFTGRHGFGFVEACFGEAVQIEWQFQGRSMTITRPVREEGGGFGRWRCFSRPPQWWWWPAGSSRRNQRRKDW